MPCGITFLGLSFVEVNPSVWVAIVLPARQFFVHRCMLLFMLASLIFAKRPRLQTRIFQINKDGDRVFVRLESILNFLCESNQLVFCGVVLKPAWHDVMTLLCSSYHFRHSLIILSISCPMHHVSDIGL